MVDRRSPDYPIFLSLLILLVALPYPRGSTFDWAWQSMIVVLSLIAITWLQYYARGKVSVTPAFKKARPMLWLFGFWLAWSWLQLLPLPIQILDTIAPISASAYKLVDPQLSHAPISIDVSSTYQQLLLGCGYLLIFVLTLLLVTNTRRLRKLVTWLVIAGVLQALLASFLVFADQYVYYISNDNSAQGTFANRNQLAGYLTQILAIGIGFLLANMRSTSSSGWRDRIRNIASALLSSKVRQRVYLAIMVITLVLTHSRMGNAAFFSSMTVAGILGLLLMKRSPRPAIFLLASLIIIDIAIVSQWFGLDKLQQRFDRLEQETATMDTRTNTVTRIDTSLYTRNLHVDAAITGTGAGTFYAIYGAYQGPDQVGFYQHAHNDYLEFLTDSGWIGLGLLGLMIIYSLLTALQALRIRHTPLLQGMAFSSSMGIIAMLIHSSADFNLRIPATVSVFMVILALAFIARAMPNKKMREM